MVVYVLNKHGKPLMPCKPAKARHLLNDGKAIVLRREPFTIQLLYGSSGQLSIEQRTPGRILARVRFPAVD